MMQQSFEREKASHGKSELCSAIISKGLFIVLHHISDWKG
jgi:hypothetical protein